MKHWTDILTGEQLKWLDEQLKSFEILSASVHGSWLYGLEREGSDVDVKVVYLPTFDDLLMGDSIKTFNKKNDELDIEVEIKSLPSFVKSCKSSDTNCMDLLHTPERLQIITTDQWERIKAKKKFMYAKNMKGVLGYIKTHSAKYTNKINRFNEINSLLDEVTFTEDHVQLKDTTLPEIISRKNYKYIKTVTLVYDHEQQYVEVCGKKYILTWECKFLKEALKNEISRYGKRTNKGSGDGMDAKSLSHALRVLCQLKELVSEQSMTFPLKEVDFVKKVKLNQVDVGTVMEEIDNRYEECIELLENSNLPDEVDISPMLAVLKEFYK